MQITKEGHYALRAVIHLATSEPRICSASEISNKQQVPPKFLARIMPKLVKDGLVRSLPGSKGGYQLARPSQKITFLEVLEAVEGPLRINVCQDQRFSECEHKDTCCMTPVWKHAHDLIADYFSQVTFDQLAEEPCSCKGATAS